MRLGIRRKTKPIKPEQLEATPLLALGALLFLSTLPMFSEMSLSINGVISLLFAYRLAVLRFPRIRPNRLLLFIMTLAGITLVLARFHTIFGYQAGMSLFAMMMALKFAETQRTRDFYIVWTIGLFYLVAQFLINQSMYLAFYFLLLVVGLFMVLLRFNRVRPTPPAQLARFVGLSFVQAVPMVVVLFLLFPRLDNPLWQLGLPEAGTGITGLSDHMEPGSINRLIENEEPVLRAEFLGDRPAKNQLYWRGPVLWSTNGKRWFGKPPFEPPERPGPLQVAEQRLDYRLIVEPHGKQWVLPLDLPASAPAGTDLSFDHQITTRKPINQRRQFNLVSYTSYVTAEPIEAAREAALRVPDMISSRTRALAAKWKAEAENQEEIVTLALRMFNQEEFVYTLTPPRMDRNPVDSFLFEERAGFCEHYSAAFTILMRLAGIPARVVTGYLGGEFNELGDYYIVRQSDAHAWTEVWLENTGWTRVDPTAAVAPERVLSSIEFESGIEGAPISFRLSEQGLLSRLIRGIRLSLDALNTNWHIWVLSYDNVKQSGLLDWLGLGSVQRYMSNLLMVLTCLVIVVILWLFASRKPSGSRDPAARDYDRFCRKMAKTGIERTPYEGPRDFALRAASQRQDLAEQIQEITNAYTRIMYQGINAPELYKKLSLLVDRFQPGIKPLSK